VRVGRVGDSVASWLKIRPDNMENLDAGYISENQQIVVKRAFPLMETSHFEFCIYFLVTNSKLERKSD
jgi:hypothetical protein